MLVGWRRGEERRILEDGEKCNKVEFFEIGGRVAIIL